MVLMVLMVLIFDLHLIKCRIYIIIIENHCYLVAVDVLIYCILRQIGQGDPIQ